MKNYQLKLTNEELQLTNEEIGLINQIRYEKKHIFFVKTRIHSLKEKDREKEI